MSNEPWRTDDLEQAQEYGAASPALVTLHFLLTALRRRWRAWVGLGAVGLLLGLSWAFATPPRSVGTVTLFLSHEPGADTHQAASTDMSLLRTRTLAAEIVEQLDLPVTPEAFQESVETIPASPDILVLEVTGSDEPAALERTRALADGFLGFRASRLRSQLDALIGGYRDRLVSLQEQVGRLDRQYAAFADRGLRDDPRASALLTRRAQLANEIESTRQSIEDATMQTEAVIDGSVVLDPATLKPAASALRSLGLPAASGLVGGAALGGGIVLLAALTSNRLRLRQEVALALGAPVRVSVRGGSGRKPRRRSRLPEAGLALIVDGLESAISWAEGRPPGAGAAGVPQAARRSRQSSLALAAVDTEAAGMQAVAGLASRLSARGLDVFVVDLSAAGELAATVARVSARDGSASTRRPVVHRPDRVPTLDQGPSDPPGPSAASPRLADPWLERWLLADAVIALVDFDPAVGAEHLGSWTDQVVVLVAAGGSSAEQLRTTGDQIRAAGLRLPFAIMVGTDRSDDTSGLGDVGVAGWRRPAAGATESSPVDGRSSR